MKITPRTKCRIIVTIFRVSCVLEATHVFVQNSSITRRYVHTHTVYGYLTDENE